MINVDNYLEESHYEELQKEWIVNKGVSGSRKIFILYFKIQNIKTCLYVSFFFFFLLLAILCSMWDLSAPTRDQTHTPCIGSEES